MLIKCPECMQLVSDKALACPHCGYPTGQPCTTFIELYEQFLEEYKRKEYSKSSLYAYTSAFGKCESLYDRQFAKLKKSDYQAVLDACKNYSEATTANLKKLFNQMYKLAIEENIVDRNYAANVVTGGRKVENGVPFTEEEIRRIWENADNPVAEVALVMIYSGCRIGELGVVRIMQDRMEGGLKTACGRKRVIPVHSRILRHMHAVKEFDPAKYRKDFYILMKKLHMSRAASGEKRTPHDCRHTFSWLADKSRMDTTSKHLIMGHSLGKDVEEKVYAHRTFEELRIEIEKIRI